MNPATATIRTAAELHEFLVRNENFDFNPDHGRDAALYDGLKLLLDLPKGEFLKALRARKVSAAEYLRALMTTAEPLADMYREILAYCERANFLRSKGGAKVEWEVACADGTIGFDPDAFRLFNEIKTSLEPSFDLMWKTKNDLMDWLVREAFAPQAPPPSRYDWSSVDLFRVLASARARADSKTEQVFLGLDRRFLAQPGDAPAPADLRALLTKHPAYPAMLQAVVNAFEPSAVELIASKFIELPFWKFRWQIYEIWVVALSLSEFEQVGFRLTTHSGGGSLIELGSRARLATHANSPGAFIYQPTYRNRNDDDIRPDIVVSSDAGATPDQVGLIIECKQRISLTGGHVEDVRTRYEAGVDDLQGEVVIVNYDDAPAWSSAGANKTRLIGNVRPKSPGEQEFRSFLRTSRMAMSLRREAWFVDISKSMDAVLDNEFRQLIAERQGSLRVGSFQLYAFALEVEERQPSDLMGNVPMSSSRDDANWEGHGIASLCVKVRECLADETLNVYIVSDIADRIERELFAGRDTPQRVRFVAPPLGLVREMMA